MLQRPAEAEGTERLREEIRSLGRMLGTVIREQEEDRLFELEEAIRIAARDHRLGDGEAGRALSRLIGSLQDRESRAVTRAFSLFFELVNLAEDRQRVRVLRARELGEAPKLRSESIAAAIERLREAGLPATALSAMLSDLQVEPVFTAHPTEAKRRSTRVHLRRIRGLLDALDSPGLVPRERERLLELIHSHITGLWQSDLTRPRRPTVVEEIEQGLHFSSSLWQVVPQLCRDLDKALRKAYGDQPPPAGPLLRFGSWIGGDRDGNPNVTTPVTERAFLELRRSGLREHLAQCRRTFETLSPSTRQVPVSRELEHFLQEAARRFPEAGPRVEAVSPNEPYRRALRIIEWRLERALQAEGPGAQPAGAYARAGELRSDLGLLASSLEAHGGASIASGELQDWRWAAEAFGLQLQRLDVRQDARDLSAVVVELAARFGFSAGYGSLREEERVRVLERALEAPGRAEPAAGGLSDPARDTLQSLQLLGQVGSAWGPEPIGCWVLSMTRGASDVLGALWLARLAGAPSLSIVPLFETIQDLRGSPTVLEKLLAHPLYRRHLADSGGVQTVMVGYSDSTKDGGYLAANWALYQAQRGMSRAAGARGARLRFFHGRGGALGRGGGPAARGILALPPGTQSLGLRVTEQGEVLAERYDDPRVAYRHLEQILWATLTAVALPAPEPRPEWTEVMESLSCTAYAHYRRLVEQPGFLSFFEQATPIGEIESLPIASRPAHRRSGRRLEDLRAIPWVFAWTQNRVLLPAWYGLGEALQGFARSDPRGWEKLREMYGQWPFFRAVLDDAALALAKADLGIARRYAELVEEDALRERIWGLLSADYQASCEGLLRVTGQPELLADIPWLKRSITVRNPNTDPLNLIQVEWLRRLREAGRPGSQQEAATLRETLRMTIQGLAAGMRTTG
jgi:phosphoenolpyruvate carboxylase